MQEWRRLMPWFTLALLFGWAGLSIYGAFLGPDLAKELFNSWPLSVFWGLVAVTLAAGFVVFVKLRRQTGLMGLHLGMLLIIVGTMVNSGAGHRWMARLTGRQRIPWSYLRLEEGQTSAAVRDRSLRRELGSLPFEVRLDGFDVEYYPLPTDPPPLYFGVLAAEAGTPHFNWVTRPLKWTLQKEARITDTPIRFRVLAFSPPAEGRPITLSVELTAAGQSQVHELICPPDEPFTGVPLSPMFPALTNLHRSASLLLARPAPPVRLYRSRVTILEAGRETSAEIRVNHPLRVAGYHLYQSSWGAEPERYTVLLAVSDSGLGLVYAGFILLAGGAMLNVWRRGEEEA